tara:strand:- start:24 stop:368 length:345 start_codon:yes stop_codon:yes gene_type:complete
MLSKSTAPTADAETGLAQDTAATAVDASQNYPETPHRALGNPLRATTRQWEAIVRRLATLLNLSLATTSHRETTAADRDQTDNTGLTLRVTKQCTPSEMLFESVPPTLASPIRH